MKKTEAPEPTGKDTEDMCPEYRFDYGKARPNRFAALMRNEDSIVSLDPDVAEVFKTSESVNSVLRALIKTMPKAEGRKRGSKQPSNRKTG